MPDTNNRQAEKRHSVIAQGTSKTPHCSATFLDNSSPPVALACAFMDQDEIVEIVPT
jgi:hypothetical protein